MTDMTAPLRPADRPSFEVVLPDGWDISEYAGRGGRALFAVYAAGRCLASCMNTPQSAARWARLLAASHLASPVSPALAPSGLGSNHPA